MSKLRKKNKPKEIKKGSVFYSQVGKKIKTERLVLSKKGALNSIIYTNPKESDTKEAFVLIDTSIKDLEKLLKTIKQSKKRLKKICKASFVHLSPDVSFFVKY